MNKELLETELELIKGQIHNFKVGERVMIWRVSYKNTNPRFEDFATIVREDPAYENRYWVKLSGDGRVVSRYVDPNRQPKQA